LRALVSLSHEKRGKSHACVTLTILVESGQIDQKAVAIGGLTGFGAEISQRGGGGGGEKYDRVQGSAAI